MCHIGYAFTWDVAEHDRVHFVCICDVLLIWECWMFPNALAEAINFVDVGGVPSVLILGATA